MRRILPVCLAITKDVMRAALCLSVLDIQIRKMLNAYSNEVSYPIIPDMNIKKASSTLPEENGKLEIDEGLQRPEDHDGRAAGIQKTDPETLVSPALAFLA